jgi:preprotein translocase subunit SecA
MTRFGGGAIAGWMDNLGLDDDDPLEHSWVNWSIVNAQRKVESYDRSQRQRSYELDGALDKQRQYLYAFRHRVVLGADLSDDIGIMMTNFVARMMQKHMPIRRQPLTWDTDAMAQEFANASPVFRAGVFAGLRNQRWQDVRDWLNRTLSNAYGDRVAEHGSSYMNLLTRLGFLLSLDRAWVEHLRRLDWLQQEKGLRVHVEEDQLHWYTLASNQSFADALAEIERHFLSLLGHGVIRERAGV